MTGIIFLQIFGIILFHWVADFLLQDTDMATNKSKSNYWLTKHVKAYMFGILPVTFFLIQFGNATILGALAWWLLNGGLHWCTDYATSRWTSKLYAQQKFYGFPAFFSVIGLDQLIHYVCLFGTYCIYSR